MLSSPTIDANILEQGDELKGSDGKMWIVMAKKNGDNHWVRSTAATRKAAGEQKMQTKLDQELFEDECEMNREKYWPKGIVNDPSLEEELFWDNCYMARSDREAAKKTKPVVARKAVKKSTPAARRPVGKRKSVKKNTTVARKSVGTRKAVKSIDIKKSRSAYLLFNIDQQKTFAKHTPIGERSKEIGLRWKKATKTTKAKYQAMADKDKARYISEMKRAGRV